MRGTGFRPPEFVLNREYTFTVTYRSAGLPVRYRGVEYPSAASGTVTVVEPDEVVQFLNPGPSVAHFTTFTLLDSHVLRGASSDGELPRFDRLSYADPDLFAGFDKVHAGLVDGAGRETLEPMVAELLSRLVSRYGVAPGAAVDVPRPSALREVRQVLSDRLDSNVSLDELAAVAGCSRSHLVRSFRQAYGAPPHRYRTLLRLASAKRLLAGGLPVAEVAARLGYFDQSQLNRRFRDVLRISAGTYARAVR